MTLLGPPRTKSANANSAPSCARAASASSPPMSACRPACAGARRACGARKWRWSPASERPGTHGSSRAATSGRRTKCSPRSATRSNWIPAERRHLFILAGRPAPDPRPTRPERVEAPLLHTLDKPRRPAGLCDGPALGRARLEPVRREAIFGDYGALDGDARNSMHLVFTDRYHRRSAGRLGRTGARRARPVFAPTARVMSAIPISND